MDDGEQLGVRCRRPCGGPITATFGQINPKLWADGHKGVDFGIPVGTEVWAALDGEVQLVGWHEKLGVRVWLLHGNIRTLYAHLSEPRVENGAAIRKGQIVGLSGNSGNSTGAHLHFGVETWPERTPLQPIFTEDTYGKDATV